MGGLRVMLAADEAAGARTLGLLAGSDHELVAVASKPPAVGGSNALLERAADLGVARLDARRLASAATATDLRALGIDVLLNVHSLTKICPEVLDVFAVGAWNLHPGPLPEAAGINVPSWAVALGWTDHGVTVHRMTAEYDQGDIAYQDRFPIRPGATGLTLSAECGTRGLRLVKALIDQLADDPSGVPSEPQDQSRRGYYGLGQPGGGEVDWSQPAAVIEAHVRAADFRPFASPWRPPRAEVGGRWVELLEVVAGEPLEPAGHVEPGTVDARGDGAHPSVATADRWITLVETREVSS